MKSALNTNTGIDHNGIEFNYDEYLEDYGRELTDNGYASAIEYLESLCYGELDFDSCDWRDFDSPDGEDMIRLLRKRLSEKEFKELIRDNVTVDWTTGLHRKDYQIHSIFFSEVDFQFPDGTHGYVSHDTAYRLILDYDAVLETYNKLISA